MSHDRAEVIPTRASLLERLKNWEDQQSWQDFFDTYWKLIYGVARKTGLTDAEAQDVVQEVLISVAKHMPTFKYDPAIGSFKAWLLNMTRWRIARQFQKRGPLVASAPTASDTTMTDPVEKVADPAAAVLDAMWEAEWEHNLLDAAIAKVKLRVKPENYRIFDLYVNREWPPEKVAAQFNVPVNQVYVTKHRVTEAIKEEVQRLESQMT
jgi:RNA polymerase sigma factor (sigma-70 family)